MVRPTRYTRKAHRRYRKYRKGAKRYKKSKSKSAVAKIRSKANARFIRKVVNRQLNPEKKRYNCLRLFTTLSNNKNYFTGGTQVQFSASDFTLHNESTSQSDAPRSMFRWYCVNLAPPRKSTGTGNEDITGYANLEGQKMMLKYIHFRGFIHILKADAFKKTPYGNIRLQILTPKGRGGLKGEALLGEVNNYQRVYDNLITDNASYCGIDIMNGDARWANYHNRQRKSKTYSDYSIRTIKRWRFNRNNRKVVSGVLTDGSGVISERIDDDTKNMYIPFNIIYRVNRTIIYDKDGTLDLYASRMPQNFPILYNIETDCNDTNEVVVNMGAEAVFTDL